MKTDKSNDFKELHPLNNEFIFVINEVSKLKCEKSNEFIYFTLSSISLLNNFSKLFKFSKICISIFELGFISNFSSDANITLPLIIKLILFLKSLPTLKPES